jgi:histidinol-phosphate aminotransferase
MKEGVDMELIEKVVKEEIKILKRVKDTLDERFEYLRLDKNERLLPFTEKQLMDYVGRIKSEELSGYGELGNVYRKLSKYLHVKQDQILIASGSDLAIKSVYEACVGRCDVVVLHSPCYAMYRVYSDMFGARIKVVPVLDNWSIDTEQMLRKVDSETKLMVLENPNGFVGTEIPLEEIERCVSELYKKKIILLIDEAYRYIEHKESGVIRFIERYPNLIVSQSFSKGHGLAGARIGCIVGNEKLIEYISRVKPMHEITNLSALALEWILDHPEVLEEYQQSIKVGKEYLKSKASSMGIPYRDTHTNFMLYHFPDEGRTRNIVNRLKEKGILIRRPFEEPFLEGWSRVCVGSIDDCMVFMRTLETILAN